MLLAASLGLTLFVVAPVRADDAEAAFRASCGGCHRDASQIARRNPGRTTQARGERWDTFLRTHHAPDPLQRALIIAYLERNR